MAKLSNFRRLFKNDYQQDQQSLVEKLSVTINNGFELLYNAMANNVSLSDNIFCTVKVVSVQVNSSGTPISPLSFKISTTGSIKGISVIKADNQTNSNVYPNSSPFMTYSQNDTTITVSNIAGLPISNKFDLTVICWG